MQSKELHEWLPLIHHTPKGHIQISHLRLCALADGKGFGRQHSNKTAQKGRAFFAIRMFTLDYTGVYRNYQKLSLGGASRPSIVINNVTMYTHAVERIIYLRRYCRYDCTLSYTLWKRDVEATTRTKSVHMTYTSVLSMSSKIDIVGFQFRSKENSILRS